MGQKIHGALLTTSTQFMRERTMRPTQKIFTLEKTMEFLLPQNLHKSQIKKGGQNLRLFRRQELRKQHIL
jgi:hypothetical protein